MESIISNKICIICTPRTGGQWCVKLIQEAFDAVDLSEFFENWNDSIFVLDNGNIKCDKFIHTKNAPFLIHSKFLERIELLKQANQNQPVAIRLFLFDHYPKDIVKFIIKELHKLNFSFIVLQRNTKDQLLSYLLAKTSSNKFNKNFFLPNEKIINPVYIDLDKIKKTLRNIFNSKKNWDDNIFYCLQEIPYYSVFYESMIEDMEKILCRELKYRGERNIQGDPLDFIINKDEILYYIENMYLEEQ